MVCLFRLGGGSDFGFGCACVHKLNTDRSGESVLMFVYLGRFVIFCLAPACTLELFDEPRKL